MSDNLYHTIIYLCLDIFSIYTIYRMVRIFLGTQTYYGKHIEIFSYFFHFIINVILYFTFKIPVVLLATNIITFILITLNYSVTITKKIFTIIFINMLSICIEIIITLLTSYKFFSPITQGEYFPLFGNFLVKIIIYFIMLLLNRLTGIKSKFQMPVIYWIVLCIIPLATIYMAVTLVVKPLSMVQILICVLIIFLINFVLIYLYDLLAIQASEKTKQLLLEQELSSFRQQLEIMQSNQKYWDKIQHDFKNDVIILDSYLDDEVDPKAKEFLSQHFKNFFNKNNVHSGVTIIDSIMNNQIREASSYDIKIKSNVFIPYEMELDHVDAITILSSMFLYAKKQVLLLNVENRVINVDIKFKYTRHRLGIKFSIPFQEADKLNEFCPPDIFEEAIKNYFGFWKISDEECVRVLVLTLYLKKENFPSIYMEEGS